MLLFHGTSGPRAIVERILEEGLLPHGGRHWAGRLTGVDEHVFACTSPIGTRDGDPIRWAQRGAWKQNKAWIVVVEVPEAAARELVVGAIRNEDLTRFWKVQAFLEIALAHRFANTRAVIELARKRGCATRELLRLVVVSCADGLVDGEPDAETLVQFESAYYRAAASQKARVATSYGLRIPEEFANDPHHPWCLGCGHQLFDVQFEAIDLLDGGNRPIRFGRGAWSRIDRETFGASLDALGRWFAACEPVAFERYMHRRATLDLGDFERTFPPPADVPRVFSRELVRGDLDTRMREPDTQLLLRRVPPEYLVGALHLGTSKRLSSLVRPTRGQTLVDNLRHLTSELRDERARSGRPVIRD